VFYIYRDGYVTTTMIVMMDLMKANSVMLSTRLVHHKSSHVKTSNAFETNIAAMG
jgi:hypothetical protein